MTQSTVLIVDDDPIGRDAMDAMLSPEGYQLEYASNGPQALEKAGLLTPDLILLDVMMPEMDGLEVCRRLRATPRLAEVPVLMLTALDDRSAMLQGLEAGADDFLSKPVDRQELRARVRTITRLNRYRTLLQQRESLRAMAERVVTAQEQERQRLSRELHDDLGQALTAHILHLRNLQGSLPLPDENLTQQLNTLIADANETLDKMRLLAQGLRPLILDTLGLPVAITAYCNEFQHRTNLSVHIEIAPGLDDVNIPDIYAITLYRILQEALTNVIKHAQASQVWVELAEDEGQLNLTIQDNGVGFNPNAHDIQGIGLHGIRERLEVVAGRLGVRSAPSRGVVLSASVPFSAGLSKIMELR
jgi:signal transduction histidine kinase